MLHVIVKCPANGDAFLLSRFIPTAGYEKKSLVNFFEELVCPAITSSCGCVINASVTLKDEGDMNVEVCSIIDDTLGTYTDMTLRNMIFSVHPKLAFPGGRSCN